MKTVVILIVMIAAIVQSSMAQVKEINNEEYDSEELNNEEFNSKEKPHYGFSISQFKTGSGFRQGAEAHSKRGEPGRDQRGGYWSRDCSGCMDLAWEPLPGAGDRPRDAS